MSKIAITGNTYQVRDRLKAIGARWDATRKAWMVDSDQAEQARSIVAAAGRAKRKPHTGECHECGAPSKGYYRCYECSIEYRDGGSRAHGGMSYYDRNGNFVLGEDD